MNEKSISSLMSFVIKIADYNRNFYDKEEIVSIGDIVLGECISLLCDSFVESLDFECFFKKKFLYAVRDYKKTKKEIFFSIESLQESGFEIQDFKKNARSQCLKKEIKKILWLKIRQLLDIERKVLLMSVVDRFPQKDISFLLNKSESRISQIKFNAINKLKEKIYNYWM